VIMIYLFMAQLFNLGSVQCPLTSFMQLSQLIHPMQIFVQSFLIKKLFCLHELFWALCGKCYVQRQSSWQSYCRSESWSTKQPRSQRTLWSVTRSIQTDVTNCDRFIVTLSSL